MGKLRDSWNEQKAKDEAKKAERKQATAQSIERSKALGPKAASSTADIRKKMHGISQSLHTASGQSGREFALINAVNLNTEATLLMIDTLNGKNNDATD